MVRSILVVAIATSMLGACDKAKSDYAKCIQLETAGNLEAADKACKAAQAADPSSPSGIAATTHLQVIADKLNQKVNQEEYDRGKAKLADIEVAQRKDAEERLQRLQQQAAQRKE